MTKRKNRRLTGEAEAYRFRNSKDIIYTDPYGQQAPADVTINGAYLNYDFTYTSQDVAYFNDVYKAVENYYPFDDTTTTGSEFSRLEDLTSKELKTAWNFSRRAYDADTESVFSVLIEKGNTQVVVDTLEDTIYISFRGTEEIADVISDTDNKVVLASQLGWLGLNSDQEDVMLHKGFADYVDAVYNELIESHIPKNTNKKIVVVRHSLGGIASQIFAYRLYLDLRFRNDEAVIDKVIAFGSPKGIYSPFNMVDNYLNIFNIFYEKDPVSMIYPLYGDALGTKIIFREDNTYRIFYRDQLTPYLAINLGNSNQYFYELKRNENYRNSNFFNGLRDFLNKYIRAPNVYNSLFTYPDGKYTRYLMGFELSGVVSGEFTEGIEYHKVGYDTAMDTMPDDLMILERNPEIKDNNIRDFQNVVNHPSYNVKLFENFEEHELAPETFRKNKTPPKILGFVSNYSSLMDKQIIIF